jgi:hypothetical protein
MKSTAGKISFLPVFCVSLGLISKVVTPSQELNRCYHATIGTVGCFVHSKLDSGTDKTTARFSVEKPFSTFSSVFTTSASGKFLPPPVFYALFLCFPVPSVCDSHCSIRVPRNSLGAPHHLEAKCHRPSGDRLDPPVVAHRVSFRSAARADDCQRVLALREMDQCCRNRLKYLGRPQVSNRYEVGRL